MDNNDYLLKIITNETKKAIEQLQVVTPSIYASIFSKYAQEHDFLLDNEQNISHNLIEIECQNLRELQSKTSTNAVRLSDSTSKALTAIKDKDNSRLNEVYLETQALKEEIEHLKQSIYKDPLTNTFNRKWLQDNELQRGFLALIDLNYFKTINDSLGHVIGDKVLIFFSNELMKLNYPVVRYGGDEFIVVFDAKISQEEAKQTLEKLREDILKKKLKANKVLFSVSFSFGIAAFTPQDTYSDILETADKNMYEDKINIKKRIKGI